MTFRRQSETVVLKIHDQGARVRFTPPISRVSNLFGIVPNDPSLVVGVGRGQNLDRSSGDLRRPAPAMFHDNEADIVATRDFADFRDLEFALHTGLRFCLKSILAFHQSKQRGPYY